MSAESGSVEREIVELHEFFGAWFRGEVDSSEFRRFEEALDVGFVIVTPRGQALDRDRILDLVRDGYGGDPSARIWIRNVEVRQRHGEIIIATYEEWQQSGDEPAQGRLSTAALRRDAAAPNGLRWAHVHETWLPPDQ